jgi:hypothetical protein
VIGSPHFPQKTLSDIWVTSQGVFFLGDAASACPLASRTMKQASVSSTLHGAGAASKTPVADPRHGRRGPSTRGPFRRRSSGSLAMLAAIRRGILLGQPLRFEGMI